MADWLKEAVEIKPATQKKASWMNEALEVKPSPGGNPATAISGAAEAGLEHLGQGLLFGHLSEAQAAAEPYTDKIFGLMTGKKVPESGYVASRDINEARLKSQSEKYPGISGGAELAGGIIPTLAVPLGGAATVAGRMGLGALSGAGAGLLQDPGSKEGAVEGLQSEEREKQALAGGLIGAASPALVGLGRAITKIPEKLTEKAEEKAFKSTGAMLKDYRKQLKRGGEDKIRDLGRFIIDNKLALPGDTFDDVATRSEVMEQDAGKKIGALYQKIKSASSGDPEKDLKISQLSLSGPSMSSELSSALKESLKNEADKKPALNKLNSMLEDVAEKGDNIPIDELNRMKSSYGKLINWAKENKEMPAVQKGYQEIYGYLSDKINNHASEIDKILGTADTKALKEANNVFSKASEISNISSDRAMREKAKNFLGLTDVIVGGAVAGPQTLHDIKEGNFGGAIKDIGVGAGAALGSKYAKLYGNPIVTKSLDILGGFLQKGMLKETANKLLDMAEKNPAAFNKAIQDLMRMNK